MSNQDNKISFQELVNSLNPEMFSSESREQNSRIIRMDVRKSYSDSKQGQ